MHPSFICCLKGCDPGNVKLFDLVLPITGTGRKKYLWLQAYHMACQNVVCCLGITIEPYAHKSAKTIIKFLRNFFSNILTPISSQYKTGTTDIF